MIKTITQVRAQNMNTKYKRYLALFIPTVTFAFASYMDAGGDTKNAIINFTVNVTILLTMFWSIWTLFKWSIGEK
jgi:hypothetical protein